MYNRAELKTSDHRSELLVVSFTSVSSAELISSRGSVFMADNCMSQRSRSHGHVINVVT